MPPVPDLLQGPAPKGPPGQGPQGGPWPAPETPAAAELLQGAPGLLPPLHPTQWGQGLPCCTGRGATVSGAGEDSHLYFQEKTVKPCGKCVRFLCSGAMMFSKYKIGYHLIQLKIVKWSSLELNVQSRVTI